MVVCELHKITEGQRGYPGQRCPWCEIEEYRDKYEPLLKAFKESYALLGEQNTALIELIGLCRELHKAGQGLFLQLDPRSGVGERMSIVWDKLTALVSNWDKRTEEAIHGHGP